MARAVRTLTQRSWLTSEAEYSSSRMLPMTRFSSGSVGIALSPDLTTKNKKSRFWNVLGAGRHHAPRTDLTQDQRM